MKFAAPSTSDNPSILSQGTLLEYPGTKLCELYIFGNERKRKMCIVAASLVLLRVQSCYEEQRLNLLGAKH